jgi:uncharacterized membrane protein (UPF0136 family)
MQTRVTTKEFLAVMYLEAVQNIPLIAGFLAGAWFWHRNALLAAACILVGSILSALSMIPTEGKIFEGHRESVAAIMANIVTFSLLMVVFIAYLEANWSSWWTDIVAGLVAGVALGTAQDLAAKERIGLIRVLALGVSCLVSFLIIRWAVETWAPLVSFVVVTLWFTLAMGGYKLWRRRYPPPD